MEHHVNPYRIYLKATRKWVEVSEKYYLDHLRYYDAFRKRHQSHGQCICPKSKFWLCDGDCFNCEFQRAEDRISLDYPTENDDGDVCSLMWRPITRTLTAALPEDTEQAENAVTSDPR